MTPRQIVLEQIHHRETAEVPYTCPVDEEVAGRLDTYYGTRQWRDRLKPYIESVTVVDTMKKVPTDRTGVHRDLFGTLWRLDQRPFHLESPGLQHPSFDTYDWPDPAAFYLDKAEREEVRRFCQDHSDLFLTAGLGWGLFETSWGLRGFENVLIDVATEPDFYEELLDRVVEQFLAYIDFTCEQLPEVDAIMFGDDWGDQRGVIIGPERWRKLFKPRYEKIYQAVHDRGKIVISHCCGSVADIMPDLIEIKLDVLESVQPEAQGMNPYELKKQWGDKMTFWGCLGSQSTIQFGTPEEISREIQTLRKEMSVGGGYILAPAKELQPGTPTENAVAVIETFTESIS
jgi:uroporphyrinogen decarboxylase